MASERDEGLAALQRGDFHTAAMQLEAATGQDPNDFQAYLYLGGVYHQLQRYADAARALTRAAELQPANAQARYNLGVAQEQSGDLQAAQASFEQALQLQSDYPIATEARRRVQARLQGPVGPGEAPNPVTDYAHDTGPSFPAPAYRPSANSSFGTASAPAPPTGAQSYSPPSAPSPTPSLPDGPQGTPGRTPGLADYGKPLPGSSPPSYVPPSSAPTEYGQPAYNPPPNYSQPPNYGQAGQGQPVDMAGNPIDPPQPAYGQPAYGQPAPPAYGQPPYGAGSPPGGYGQPGYAPPRSPYGQPPPAAPYGQQPYGAGYAPPGTYGYGNAPQYVVPLQPCQEARNAMILSIVGAVVPCIGIVLHPMGLHYAIKARKMMAQDANLTGQTEAMVGLIISSIYTTLYAICILFFLFSLLVGMH
jgi:hypothetical protein